MDVSAYSLVALTRGARPYLHAGSSIFTLTYYGAEKVVANYNVMGVAKAALEASVRYLAADLGPDGIRVNAISAGPIRTLAAAGIAGFKKMYGEFDEIAPLRSNITIDDVGRTGVYLAIGPVTGRDRRGDLRRRRLQHPRRADRRRLARSVSCRGGRGGSPRGRRPAFRRRSARAHCRQLRRRPSTGTP